MKRPRLLPYSFIWFSLFPILALYSLNSAEVQPLSVIKAAAASVLFFALVFFCFKKARFSEEASTLLTALGAGGFFSYGHFYAFLKNILMTRWIERVDDGTKFIYHWTSGMHIVLTLAGLAVFFAAASNLRRRGKELEPFLKVLNVIGIALILIPALNIGKAHFVDRESNIQKVRTIVANAGTNAPDAVRPDIYYIILDGFTRIDMMKKAYNVDLEPYRKSLQGLGFYIAEESRSNYSQTLLSLASSLNMRYLPLNVDGWKKKQQGKQMFFDMIAHNEVASFLRERGYQYVHIGSVVSMTASNPQADVLISYDQGIFGNDFYRSLFETTWLKVFDFMISHSIAKMHLYNFEQLSKIPGQIDSPKFVFAHFVMPHSPYVFDKNGNIKSDIRQADIWDPHQNNWGDADDYREQVMYAANKSLITALSILKKSKTPPIIILQGDYGTNLRFSEITHEKEAKFLRHSELNVYYFPDKDYSLLWPGISPVNSFRVIFNKYFGTHLEMLPDYSTYTGQG